MFIPVKLKIDLPEKFRIDLPEKFRIDLPEKFTVVHLLDFDEAKCERLTRSIATSVGVVVTVVIIIGGIARYFLTAAHRQPAEAAMAAAPAAPEAAEKTLIEQKLLLMAISNISYTRKLFPRSYFNDKSVPSQVMMIKDLMPKDAESERMIDWIKKGVCDALNKKYLKTLLFCVCEKVGGPMIEEYAFSFSCPNSEITPDQMRGSACKFDLLIHFLVALDEMPEERTILMKLLYCDGDDLTDMDYEPQFFRSCTEEVNNPWTKKPLKMKVANVKSKHLVFDLEVKSVLYGSAVIQDVNVSLGASCVEVASDLETKPADSRERGESSSSQSKRFRTASVVKEPILQHTRKLKLPRMNWNARWIPEFFSSY